MGKWNELSFWGVKIGIGSVDLDGNLNLSLAWKRVRNEEKERNFVSLPFESILLELNLDDWLKSCCKKIIENRYNPGPLYPVDVPKGNSNIRAGAYLYPIDKLFYTAFVGSCYQNISDALLWSNNRIDFSYVLARDPRRVDWVGSPFKGWSKFRNVSLQKIKEGAKYVFITDISGFYDNIEINTLSSDLRAIDCDEDVIANLSSCLKRWAHVGARGIPQGYNASDILAKLYLNSIDEYLRDSGINFLRYVDDIRIFCNSEKEAKQSIIILTKILRKKGLSLQSGKSKIHTAEEAESKIKGIIPILQKVEQDFLDEVFGADNPYGSLHEADAILIADGDRPSIDPILQAYKDHIIGPGISKFDKTLFHFLLNRIGNASDSFATEHCLEVLKQRPEETGAVLKYLFNTEQYSTVEHQIISILTECAPLYPFQAYQVLKRVFESPVVPSQDFLFQCRRFVKSREFPFYLRAYSKAILGKSGSFADLDLLETLYSDTSDQFEQSTIICCLGRMEKTRRNTFLQRAANDGELQKRAVEFAKRKREYAPQKES